MAKEQRSKYVSNRATAGIIRMHAIGKPTPHPTLPITATPPCLLRFAKLSKVGRMRVGKRGNGALCCEDRREMVRKADNHFPCTNNYAQPIQALLTSAVLAGGRKRSTEQLEAAVFDGRSGGVTGGAVQAQVRTHRSHPEDHSAQPAGVTAGGCYAWYDDCRVEGNAVRDCCGCLMSYENVLAHQLCNQQTGKDFLFVCVTRVNRQIGQVDLFSYRCRSLRIGIFGGRFVSKLGSICFLLLWWSSRWSTTARRDKILAS